MNRGKFMAGGVFGGMNPSREPSPKQNVSPLKGSATSYNHDQRDPIIVRGSANVDPNHLVIRKNELRN